MNFNNAFFETSFGTAHQLKTSVLPEIVFSGKSNVGKSSLINKISNRKNLARTSSKPGKTGTINLYNIDKKINFVDLPGYGFAKVSDVEKKRWAELIEHFFHSGRNIKLVLQILDIRHEPTQNDTDMIDFLLYNNINFKIILTKLDKLNKNQFVEQMNFFENLLKPKSINFIAFSAVTGQGLPEIKSLIERSL